MKPYLEQQLASFAAKLKELRLRRGWTLDDLARHSGISKTFLSRLESGGRQPSISVVLTLSHLFEVSVATLFETQMAMEPCVVVRSSEVTPQVSKGLTFLPLSNAEHHFNLKPIRVTVALDREGTEQYHHPGEEFIYVLSGKLALSLGNQTYDLNPGDAAHFDSRVPHRLIARENTEPEVLLVAAPTTSERELGSPKSELRAQPTGDTVGRSLLNPSVFSPQLRSTKTEGSSRSSSQP